MVTGVTGASQAQSFGNGDSIPVVKPYSSNSYLTNNISHNAHIAKIEQAYKDLMDNLDSFCDPKKNLTSDEAITVAKNIYTAFCNLQKCAAPSKCFSEDGVMLKSNDYTSPMGKFHNIWNEQFAKHINDDSRNPIEASPFLKNIYSLKDASSKNIKDLRSTFENKSYFDTRFGSITGVYVALLSLVENKL